MEARWAQAISSTSFSKPPPEPSSLPETAQLFFRHLPRHSRGGPGVAANEAWERKTALRNTIHDAYLRALARLPFNGPDGAPTMPSLLPALLAGGHCFGPLPDGASNVIVSTVWIHAASFSARFAAADTVVDVVDLNRIKVGSLASLTRVQPLDDDAADRNYDYYGILPRCRCCRQAPQLRGLRCVCAVRSRAVTELLANSSGLLSTEDIERLSALLVPRSASPLQACVVPESKLNLKREERIRSWHAWRRKCANMANTIGGPELQLKVVCGASIGDLDYQRINFMATPRDKPADIQLFFAEHANQTGIVLCCPVQAPVSRIGMLFHFFCLHHNNLCISLKDMLAQNLCVVNK